jgi:hypothetical protein
MNLKYTLSNVVRWLAIVANLAEGCARRGLSNVQSFHVNIRLDDVGYLVARRVELPAAITQARTEEEVYP